MIARRRVQGGALIARKADAEEKPPGFSNRSQEGRHADSGTRSGYRSSKGHYGGGEQTEASRMDKTALRNVQHAMTARERIQQLRRPLRRRRAT